MNVAICLVVALPAEARPLIDHYRLARWRSDLPFAIHRSDDIALIRSGVGKTNAAAATALLGALNKNRQSLWLNIGIAGHRSLPIGELVTANPIIDLASGQRWDTPPSRSLPLASQICRTVDQASGDYFDTGITDMEASGFISIATRFTRPEHILVLKIISDNADHPARKVTASQVEQLCQQQVRTIAQLTESLGPAA